MRRLTSQHGHETLSPMFFFIESNLKCWTTSYLRGSPSLLFYYKYFVFELGFESLMGDKEDWYNPRFANLLRDKFDHLPPTLFIVAECDPLRDDSYGQFIICILIRYWLADNVLMNHHK